MKKLTKLLVLLTLALALLLAQPAWAEPDEVVKGVFDALVAEDSGYSQDKALYAEYYPEMVFEETLADDGFTLAVSGSEYMDGSWTFTREGDYLTAAFGQEDYGGAGMVLYVVKAVGAYYDMDASLMSGYVYGLSALDIESEYFLAAADAETGATTFRIYIAGPWDMKELDEMAISEEVLSFYGPLSEDYTSMASSIGKMMMVANGSADDLTLLVGEYGGLDELALRSIINIVSALQPSGWEDFTASYTELAEVETEGWSVRLNADMAAVGEIIDDASADYSYALIRFGTGSAYEEEYECEPVDPEEAPSEEAFRENYFDVILGLEPGTAGASLKTAAAASDVCAFAEAYALYNPDVEPMRANMLAAFEGLSKDEQALFWENFETVRALLDDCLEDYEANRAVFEDAGVAETMDEVMYDPLNRLAWENLRNHTLTMGNAMNAG